MFTTIRPIVKKILKGILWVEQKLSQEGHSEMQRNGELRNWQR